MRRWSRGWSRVMLIAGIGALAVAECPAVAQGPPSAPKTETVLALLQVNIKEEREAFELAQTLLIKSRPSLKLALARLTHLEVFRNVPDPVAWLERNLRVDFADDGQTLRISLHGAQDDDLAAIVNAVTDVYLEQLRMRRERKVEELRTRLRAKIAKASETPEPLDDERENRREARVRRAMLELEVAVLRMQIENALEPQVEIVQRAKGAQAS